MTKRAQPTEAQGDANLQTKFDIAMRELRATRVALAALKASHADEMAKVIRQCAAETTERYWQVEVSRTAYENGDQPRVIAEGLSRAILMLLTPEMLAAEKNSAERGAVE